MSVGMAKNSRSHQISCAVFRIMLAYVKHDRYLMIVRFGAHELKETEDRMNKNITFCQFQMHCNHLALAEKKLLRYSPCSINQILLKPYRPPEQKQ
jgi:hypothetical protein